MGGFLTAADILSDPYYFMGLSDDASMAPSGDDVDWLPNGLVGPKQPKRRFDLRADLPQQMIAPPPAGIDRGAPLDPPTESPNSVLFKLAMGEMAGAAPEAEDARPGPRLVRPGEHQLPAEPGMPTRPWSFPNGAPVTPPFLPSGGPPFGPGGGGPPPMAQWPGDAAPGKGSTWKQRLQYAVPRMLNSAVAAVATPSIAGGGAMDIARSMMAADKYQSGKDAEVYDRAQARRKQYFDEMEKQSQAVYHQAGAEAARAHADYYRLMAGAKVEPNLTAILTSKWQAETDPAKKAALFSQVLESMGHAPKGQYTAVGNRVFDNSAGKFIDADEDSPAGRMKMMQAQYPGVPFEHMPDDAKNYVWHKDQQPPRDSAMNQYEVLVDAYGIDKAGRIVMEHMLRESQNQGRDPALTALTIEQIKALQAKQLDEVENTKAKRLKDADTYERQELKRLSDLQQKSPALYKPEDVSQVHRQAQSMKQAAQDEYERKVYHGRPAPDHWTVGAVSDPTSLASGGNPWSQAPAGGPAPTPVSVPTARPVVPGLAAGGPPQQPQQGPPPPPQQPTGKVFPMTRLRQYAIDHPQLEKSYGPGEIGARRFLEGQGYRIQ